MTKYILHGGNTRILNADNDSFFQEMLKVSGNKVNVLLNYFSREDGEIQTLTEQDKKRFINNAGSKELMFDIAQESKLVEQLQKADIFISEEEIPKNYLKK